ncbi:putative ABC transport system ATP-binding protein [Bacilli bacterium PM5-3]|nr:putative ABC transport system ATP-binding protein [Bacilli bacterium PM5-3]MDH6603751.1 putative ABC transport system ATP-binding protein [Bacilli bacterium PM5-9]
MLEIKDLSFSYDNKQMILENVNMKFKEGRVIAIQGESGQGKSTLLAILAGLESNFDGQIILNDELINKGKLYQYNKDNISIIFQELNLIKYLDILDNIKQGCFIKNKVFEKDKMFDYLKMLNLDNLNLAKFPSTLSGGQQQRIAIIRALLSDTKIILADEPTASIDAKNADTIISEMKLLASKENKIVIVVTHDNLIAKQCDEVYLLENTKLVKQRKK